MRDSHAPTSDAPPEIDTGVAHNARVWNHWLGGKDAYDVDRQVGDQVAGAPATGRVTLRVTGGGKDRTRSKAVPTDGTAVFVVRTPTRGVRLQVTGRFVSTSADYTSSAARRAVVRLTR